MVHRHGKVIAASGAFAVDIARHGGGHISQQAVGGQLRVKRRMKIALGCVILWYGKTSKGKDSTA